jgi:hypothetical protein
MEATRAAPLSEGQQIAGLIERIVRGIERGSKGWTAARKKESLQRVLDGSRSDAKRLQQRLTQLVASWDTEPGAERRGLVAGRRPRGAALGPRGRCAERHGATRVAAD